MAEQKEEIKKDKVVTEDKIIEPKVVQVKNESDTNSTGDSQDKKKIKIRRKPTYGKKGKGKGGKKGRRREDEDGIDKKIVSIRRVTRVYEGGKRMRLSVCLVAGDKKGHVGVGTGKGLDVKAAEEKALKQAKKSMVEVPLYGKTIPHEIYYKKGAAKIFMKPASRGTGIVAGSALRAVLELAGVKDVLTKVIGTNNPIINVQAAVEAMSQMRPKQKLEKPKQVITNKDINNKEK